MAKENISVTEYATIRGISRSAVKKQLKYGRKLLGVTFSQKVGNGWVLTVERKNIPIKDAEN